VTQEHARVQCHDRRVHSSSTAFKLRVGCREMIFFRAGLVAVERAIFLKAVLYGTNK
jgi:hypothetical protein